MKWAEAAEAVRWKIQPFIDGASHASCSAETVENINPANERVLCLMAAGGPSDIDRAVRVARRSFEDRRWSGCSAQRRADVLLKLAGLIVDRKEQLALLDSLEMGKPIRAALKDVEHFAPAVLRSCAGFADQLLGVSAPLSAATLALNAYEPRGVIGAITPWNFPTVNAVVKFAPALAAGNTVVLKPSELASSSALLLAELALEAGIPPGVFNVVPGKGSTVGAALAMHPDVDMLSFTGSTVTGRKLMELSGLSNGKPLLLECGGKSPQIVFSDISDLDYVADATVQSFLWNQGQVCSARTRLLVHEEIKDALLDKVIQRAGQYRPGHPLEENTTFGPLASPSQRDRVKRYIAEGLKSGARAALRGAVQEAGGCNVWPTVFDRVTEDMSIAREEIFGPVLCVQTFTTEEEAIALANATAYGLVATVWTRDLGRGKRLACAIRAGDVHIRTSGKEEAASEFYMSHEPQKASGFGSELGLRGLQSYSTLKSVTFSGS